MINGNITEFLDKVYYGEELFFEYQGIDYFLEISFTGDIPLYLHKILSIPNIRI